MRFSLTLYSLPPLPHTPTNQPRDALMSNSQSHHTQRPSASSPPTISKAVMSHTGNAPVNNPLVVRNCPN